METQYNLLNQLILITSLLILISSQAARAQHSTNEGYWVVESNVINKDFTIIKFYNNSHSLIYEEKLTGIYLDIRRQKNVKMLNRTLRRVQHNCLVARQIKGYSGLIAGSIAKKRLYN